MEPGSADATTGDDRPDSVQAHVRTTRRGSAGDGRHGPVCRYFHWPGCCALSDPGKSPSEVRLKQVMTRNPESKSPGCTAIEALRLMRDGGFRHVAVVADGRVVGVVSRGDFRGLEQNRLDEETRFWERV